LCSVNSKMQRSLLIIVALFAVVSCRTPETELLHEFIQPALEKVNSLRADLKLKALVLDDDLTSGAQDWAESEARTDHLSHSCGPCDEYSELLAEKLTTGRVPKGQAAVDWALGRWFGALINGTPGSAASNAYIEMLKRPKLAKMGIGIAYGTTSEGEKTAFAVGRFANAKAKYGR